MAFELVDPDDHWAPVELTCFPNSLAETFGTTTTIPSSVPHEEAAAQLLDGLAEGDRIRGAGYGAEWWALGFTYVVDREGLAVARLVLSPLETYGADFSACADSGIALQTDGGQPIPDVLVLRCEGLGPAVDASTVRLQADGLHIEATNVADATVIVIDPQDGTIEALAIPFGSATEDLVLDIPSGVFWIGCRVPDEEGNIVGGPAEFPDTYLEVTVLPVE